MASRPLFLAPRKKVYLGAEEAGGSKSVCVCRSVSRLSAVLRGDRGERGGRHLIFCRGPGYAGFQGGGLVVLLGK